MSNGKKKNKGKKVVVMKEQPEMKAKVETPPEPISEKKEEETPVEYKSETVEEKKENRGRGSSKKEFPPAQLEKFPLLTTLQASVNHRGKPTGKKEIMLNESGLAVGADKREQVPPQMLLVMEKLVSKDFHFVLQKSEGDGIKVVAPDGMTRCVLLCRNGNLSSFNLRANKEDSEVLLDNAEIPRDLVNIRNNAKSQYVYADFPATGLKSANIVSFIASLPASVSCSCGDAHDVAKENKKVVKKEKIASSSEKKDQKADPVVYHGSEDKEIENTTKKKHKEKRAA